MFKISKVSDPIFILLPIETDSGMLDTYISVVIPNVSEALIFYIIFVTNVVIPIL